MRTKYEAEVNLSNLKQQSRKIDLISRLYNRPKLTVGGFGYGPYTFKFVVSSRADRRHGPIHVFPKDHYMDYLYKEMFKKW